MADASASPIERLRRALSKRYLIERELGAGGMATVYLAHDIKHDRNVALKVLKPELAAVIGAERFVQEIKTTAALQHPHILPLFDSGVADSFLYYVMPFIDGETLRSKLDRETQLGIDESVKIAVAVADALDYAHRHQVIHRDIKPENILLHEGRPMVADFGIALAVSAAAGGRMTETGLSLGTPHYMSPEQATAEKEISARSDIYSLASVLYEMLTGNPPHTGASAQQIIMKIVTEEAAPVTKLRKSVPNNVAAAVAKALEKLPADRFASASEFGAALMNPGFALADSVRATEAQRTRTRRFGWVAAAIVIFTLSGAYALGRRNATASQEIPITFAIDMPDSVASVQICCSPSQAWAPDGKTLVFAVAQGQQTAIYKRHLDQLAPELIPGTVGASGTFLSPDGEWLGFQTGEQLNKVPLSGGPVTTIGKIGRTAGASWGDDGSIVFANNLPTDKLWRIPASGGTPIAIGGLDTLSRYAFPTVLPGSKSAVVTVFNVQFTPGDVRIGVMNLSSGKVDTLGYGLRAEYSDGMLIWGATDASLVVQPFDAARGKLTGSASVILSSIGVASGIEPEFAATRGWLAYQPGSPGNTELFRIIGPAGASVMSLPMEWQDLEDPAISPDGRRVAMRLGSRGTDSNKMDIWILDREPGTLTRLTVGGAQTPVWSHDGRRIAYHATGDSVNRPGIYVRDVDRAVSGQLVLAGARFYPASWFPGDRSLLLVSAPFAQNTQHDIGAITIGDSTPRWIVNSEFDERHGQLSADGRLLAYTSNRNGRRELYVQSMTGVAAPVQVSVDGGSSPRWSPDGHALYYVNNNTIQMAKISAGSSITVTSRAAMTKAGAYLIDLNLANVNWDVFPDGKQFLIIDELSMNKNRLVLLQHWADVARGMGAKK